MRGGLEIPHEEASAGPSVFRNGDVFESIATPSAAPEPMQASCVAADANAAVISPVTRSLSISRASTAMDPIGRTSLTGSAQSTNVVTQLEEFFLADKKFMS